jgi:hypothetical protein
MSDNDIQLMQFHDAAMSQLHARSGSQSVTLALRLRLMRALQAAAIALLLAGCGSSGTTPVEGTVLLDGQPLAGASIHFVAQEGPGRDATGHTDSNGQFAMSTFQPRDGMVPGNYKVVISPPTGTADTAAYASADEAMVAAGKREATQPSAASAFPQKYARPDQTPLTQEVPVSGKLRFDLKR